MAAETQTQAAGAEAKTATEVSLLDQAISATKSSEPDEVQDLLRTLTQEAMSGTVTFSKNLTQTFNKAIDNIKPRLEVKSRRVGGATYQVPMEVQPGRQLALAMRWLVTFASKRKGIPLKDALAYELKDAAAGQGSAIKKRDDTHKMAQANRAFAHFRW